MRSHRRAGVLETKPRRRLAVRVSDFRTTIRWGALALRGRIQSRATIDGLSQALIESSSALPTDRAQRSRRPIVELEHEDLFEWRRSQLDEDIRHTIHVQVLSTTMIEQCETPREQERGRAKSAVEQRP